METIDKDWRKFINSKPIPIGGILNDCILRRLCNAGAIEKVNAFSEFPVAGYSSFGELWGLNINETMTAVFFFLIHEGETFGDEYVDNLPVYYSNFERCFLERHLSQITIVNKLRGKVIELLNKNSGNIPIVLDNVNLFIDGTHC